MTELTRDTDGAAKAARYLKDLERRIQSNEEDLRGDQAAVPLERTTRVGLELDAGPLTVYTYDRDSIRLAEPDWTSLTRRQKIHRLRDNHAAMETWTSGMVTTNGLRDWVLPAIDPSGNAPAIDALYLGTGTGRWLSTNTELYDPDPTRVEIAQRQITSANARGRYLIDEHELNGLSFTEAGLAARDDSFLAAHGPLTATLEKTPDKIIRIDTPLAFSPRPTEDGTLTRGFRRWLAYQSITQGDRRPPLTTAAIGTTTPAEPDERVTQVPGRIGVVPVADWSGDETDDDVFTSPMITMAVDSTRLNGNTLRGMGVTNDDPRDEYRLHSLTRIDPPIEKTASKRATLNTIIDISHEIEDLDRVDVGVVPPTTNADALPETGVSLGAGAAIRPDQARVNTDAEVPSANTGTTAAVLPPAARPSIGEPTPSVTATKVTTQLVDDFQHNNLSGYYDGSGGDPSGFTTTTYSRSNWPQKGSYSIRHRKNSTVARMASASGMGSFDSSRALPYYPSRGDEIVLYCMSSMASPSTNDPAYRTRFRFGWGGPSNNYDVSLHFRSNTVDVSERTQNYGWNVLDNAGMGTWNAYQVIRLEIYWRTNGSLRVRVYDDATNTLRAELNGTPTRWTPSTGGIEFIEEIGSGVSGNIYWDWVHVKR